MNKNNLTTFYIVRHGQSVANVQKIVQGTVIDTSLTEIGRQQAKVLAEELKEVRFDAIYSSDSRRAKETADIIGKIYNLPVVATSKLRERNFRKYEGMNMDSFLALHVNFNEMTLDEKLDHKLDENQESNREGALRLIAFLEQTAEKHPHEKILIITHGGVIRPFLILNGKGDFDSIGGLDNTGYIKVRADSKSYHIEEMKGVRTWAEKHPQPYSSSEEVRRIEK